MFEVVLMFGVRWLRQKAGTGSEKSSTSDYDVPMIERYPMKIDSVALRMVKFGSMEQEEDVTADPNCA